MSEENNIEVVKEQQPKMTAEERDAKLIEWGYYNKEYSPDDSKSEEYPFEEFKWYDNGITSVYYKKIPKNMTDEEFERIAAKVAEKQARKREMIKNKNIIAIIFTVLGYVVFLAAFILGFVLGRDPGRSRYHFYFPLALAYWGGGFVTGMFMLGISEVITLLETIKNKIK